MTPAVVAAGEDTPKSTGSEVNPDELSDTVTLTVPGIPISALETVAVRIESVANVVGMGLPDQRTTESLVKPLPFTNKVKSGSPAMA